MIFQRSVILIDSGITVLLDAKQCRWNQALTIANTSGVKGIAKHSTTYLKGAIHNMKRNLRWLLHNPLESSTLPRHPLYSRPTPWWDRPHSLLLRLNSTGYCASRNRSIALALLVHGVLTPIHRTCYSGVSPRPSGVYIPACARLSR